MDVTGTICALRGTLQMRNPSCVLNFTHATCILGPRLRTGVRDGAWACLRVVVGTDSCSVDRYRRSLVDVSDAGALAFTSSSTTS